MRQIRDAGFTLVELIVVTLIIGILAAIAAPVFLSTLDQARVSALEAAIATARLSTALVVVEEQSLPVGSARDEILQAHGDSAITLALTGSGTQFCISGEHALISDVWAATNSRGPVRGATCSSDGSIVAP